MLPQLLSAYTLSAWSELEHTSLLLSAFICISRIYSGDSLSSAPVLLVGSFGADEDEGQDTLEVTA
jgi:hypothetical protein